MTHTFWTALLKRRGLKWSLLRIAILILLFVLLPLTASIYWMTAMPGISASSTLPQATTIERKLESDLERTVQYLALDVGERNMQTSGSLEKATAYLISRFAAAGLTPLKHEYRVNGTAVNNLIVEIRGKTLPEEIVVTGAHYDSVYKSPGADDNASGVAANLELALHFAKLEPRRTLRFAFFVNEEAPFAMTPNMGSYVYAASCRARKDRIIAMFSLESLGYYTDEPGSQQYPSAAFKALYPTTGNFITFVGDIASRDLVRKSLAEFRQNASIPSHGAALPRGVAGVGWSDHWSFWVHGYQALMVTGTAPFRNPNYHTSTDTPETLDYGRMARVVDGLKAVLAYHADKP